VCGRIKIPWELAILKPTKRDFLSLEYLVLLFAVILVVVVRVRLLSVPLERDEGEYAYAGQLLLQGIPPFKETYNMKMPGIYGAYALCMAIFGQTTTGIHLGLLAVNLGSIVMLFLLVRRLIDGPTAASAAAMFAVLAVSQSVLGVFAHATHFVVFFALMGSWCASKAIESQKLIHIFLSGLAFGIAFTMKQHAAPFIALAGSILIWHSIRSGEGPKKSSIKAGVFATAVFLPYAAIAGVMVASGSFKTFWFWTVDYARAYVNQIPLARGARTFYSKTYSCIRFDPAIWILGIAGMVSIAFMERFRKVRPLLYLVLIASLASIMPGFYFREHYYVLLFPALAVFAAIGIERAAGYAGFAFSTVRVEHLRAAIVFATIAVTALNQRQYYFINSPADVSRSIYNIDEFLFSKSVDIADYVAKNTSPDEKIAVLGSEPQVYFYAKRRAATGYMYAYPLMEIQPFARKMQDELIEEIERNKPRFIVFFGSSTSWMYKKSSDIHVLDWFHEYSQKEYDVVGFVEPQPNGKIQELWGPEARQMKPATTNFIVVLRRKAAESA
jgi:hypothetical protein